MSAAHALEHAEHTGHAGGGHDGTHGHGGTQRSGKLIGLTMGLIGVLIALCAALVGGERNEMSRSMIEQTQATSDATSASIKYRLVMIAVEQIRQQPKDSASPALRERFVQLFDDYNRERKITAAWSSAYQPLVDAHFSGAEGFEHAQLVAEIAIVFASLAVLLTNRLAWIVSIVLAVGSIGLIGKTWVETRAHVAAVESVIEKHHEGYIDLRKAHTGDNSDAIAIDALDPDHSIRKAIDEKQKAKAE